jgi:KaiC/GvpD/RAD55 family RecA-like ATPase
MEVDDEDDRLRPLSLAELYAQAEEAGDIQWVVPLGIARGYTHLLSAPPKSGKTWFALTLARAVCRGEPWAGAEGIEQGNVLWIDEEMGAPLLAKRLKQLEFAPGLPFYTLSLAGFRLDQGGDVARVIKEASACNASLIVIDSLRRCHRLDENDNSQMRNLMPMMKALATTGAAVVVLHHGRKRTLNDGDAQERSSGALDLIAQVDMVYGMKRDRNTYTLKCRSARLVGEEQAANIAFRLTDNDDGTVNVESLDVKHEAANGRVALETAILFHLTRNPGDNTSIIREAVGERRADVSAALARMVDDGRLSMELGAKNSKQYRVNEDFCGDDYEQPYIPD